MCCSLCGDEKMYLCTRGHLCVSGGCLCIYLCMWLCVCECVVVCVCMACIHGWICLSVCMCGCLCMHSLYCTVYANNEIS